jgi:hypothetical protein
MFRNKSKTIFGKCGYKKLNRWMKKNVMSRNNIKKIYYLKVLKASNNTIYFKKL